MMHHSKSVNLRERIKGERKKKNGKGKKKTNFDNKIP
jgi:hypothetical protein